MGQFRDRMDEELRIRGYSANTRECYVRCVRNFVRHFMRPPDQLTLEHIRQYQLHLTRDRHVAWSYFIQAVCALRFFSREVLKTDWEVRHIPYQKTGRTLPEILSPEEVAALFKATGNLKHRALLMTMYSGGLRASEVTRLRVSDIDRQRSMIRIEQGKGCKDRSVMLSPYLRAVLQDYEHAVHPTTVLFPSRAGGGPLSPRSLHRIFQRARRSARITKHVSPLFAPARRRHPSARRRHQPARDPAAPGPPQLAHHAALHAGRGHAAPGHPEPAGSPAGSAPPAPRHHELGLAVNAQPAGAGRSELADIVRAHADDLDGLSLGQRRLLNAIAQCRTAPLGGHRRQCAACGYEELSYNSCRNRHCPKCQGLDEARWVEAQQGDLLPVPYFHIVFTVPTELHALFLTAPSVAYTLLFTAVAKTLEDVARRRLGAAIGFTAVLHTWTQLLL